MTKDQLKKFIVELDKENKKLKEINESQNEEIQRFKDNAMADMTEITKLEEENKKLKEEVRDLVERNIELDKKYMLVLTENKKLKEMLTYVTDKEHTPYIDDGR